MKNPEQLFFFHTPLVVISTFTSIMLVAVIAGIAIALFGFYRSNIKTYSDKMLSLGVQLTAMQKHLDYASKEEAKARSDAKRSAAARETLLTSLSHEIRTPMNGILGMAVFLEETNLSTEQRDYLDTIINSGRILLSKVDEVMANDNLEQSKIDRTITVAQKKNTDLRNCVEEVIETFAVKACNNSVELLYEIDEALPQQVLTDNKRIQQVLTNLVENIMNTSTRQQVLISLHLVKHNSTNTSPVLGFAVSDMPLGNASRIGLLLVQGSVLADETSEKEGDKQLGLTICKKLVEEMGGQIKKVSTDNTCAFIFTIPLQAVTALHAAGGGYNLKDFEGKRVLIASSHEMAADILKRQLQKWKLNAVIATDGKMARELAAAQSFQLVITETELPDMTGMQLATLIRQTFNQLPVILLNSVNDQRYRTAGNIASEITILNKPLKQHSLFDNLLSNLRQTSKGGSSQDISVKNLSAEFSRKYPLRILIAEDNPVNQKWAMKILDKMGYQADVAENGHIVLDMVGKTSYDLLLMDVQMPEMDGLEATRMIRLCLAKQPIIIAMTANVMHGDRIACMQAGMNDYISKPVQLGELVNMLEKWAHTITDQKHLDAAKQD